MRSQDEAAFDYERYKRLLREAVDERKRLELIQTLIDEKAMARLAAHREALMGAGAGSPNRAVAGLRR